MSQLPTFFYRLKGRILQEASDLETGFSLLLAQYSASAWGGTIGDHCPVEEALLGSGLTLHTIWKGICRTGSFEEPGEHGAFSVETRIPQQDLVIF